MKLKHILFVKLLFLQKISQTEKHKLTQDLWWTILTYEKLTKLQARPVRKCFSITNRLRLNRIYHKVLLESNSYREWPHHFQNQLRSFLIDLLLKKPQIGQYKKKVNCLHGNKLWVAMMLNREFFVKIFHFFV